MGIKGIAEKRKQNQIIPSLPFVCRTQLVRDAYFST